MATAAGGGSLAKIQIEGETAAQCFAHMAQLIAGPVSFDGGKTIEYGLPSSRPQKLSYKAGRHLIDSKIVVLGGWTVAERDSFLRFLDVEKAPLHRDEFVRMERVRVVSCFALSLLN